MIQNYYISRKEHIEQSNAYSDWFMSLMLDFSKKYYYQINDHIAYILENSYFITFVYDQKELYRLSASHYGTDDSGLIVKDIGEIILNNVQDINRKLARKINKVRNYNNNFHKLPFCVTCIDVANSRHSKNLSTFMNYHSHGVWLNPPNTNELFLDTAQALMEQPLFKMEHAIDKYEFTKITNAQEGMGDLKSVASYIGKCLPINSHASRINEDFRLFPPELFYH